MTRWLVTGAGGLLGREVADVLRRAGADVIAFSHAQLDVTDHALVAARVAAARPHIVVNCAAWTAVDEAESHPEKAMAVNADGAANVAMACAMTGARLIFVSTDYVFSGTSREPYAEDDVPGPATVYGRSKLAGERAVLTRLPGLGYVVRTAWLYGACGECFVRTMVRLEAARDEVQVVADQHGQPTWARDVARQIVLLPGSAASPGIYHVTSQGATTWLGLARLVFTLLGADPARVRPITTAELGRPARRPAYSVLGHGRWVAAGLPLLPHWADSLARALPAIAEPAGRVSPGRRP